MLLKSTRFKWVWWYTPRIPTLGRLRQEDGEIEANLGYPARSCHKIKENLLCPWDKFLKVHILWCPCHKFPPFLFFVGFFFFFFFFFFFASFSRLTDCGILALTGLGPSQCHAAFCLRRTQCWTIHAKSNV